MLGRPPGQRNELLGHLDGDAHLRLTGAGAQMGRRHDQRMLHQLQCDSAGGRLLLVDIDGGATALAGLQGGQQIGLVHDAAAGDIDDANAAPALGQRIGGDQVCGTE